LDVVTKVGLDSIPALRLGILQGLAGAPSDHTFATSEIATRLGYPKTTAKRALEDLAAPKLVHCYPQGERRETLWALADWTRKRLEQVRSAEPEKSGHAWNGTDPEKSAVTSLFSCKTLNDFSGSDGVAA
jgi:DNA-binding MarR family transcriptional regulator